MIGSLCSGYGGLDLAVEAVFGQPVAWHCENEDAPSRVLEAHWPGVPNLGDLTTVAYWLHNAEPVDILTAGYPCQPFSHAGQRKGTDDERHLWPYVADAIRGVRPRIVVLENVPGHRSLGFDVVLGDLAALRYDVRWASLRAADVGAPHGRERVFIVASVAHSGGRRWRAEADRRERADGGGPRGSAPGPGADAAADAADVGHERGGGARHGRPGPANGRSDPTADPSGDGRHERRPEPARLIRRPDASLGGASLATNATPGGRPDQPLGGDQARQHERAIAGAGGRDSARATAARVHDAGGASAVLAVAADADSDRRESVGRVDTWGKYEPAIRRWERVLARAAPPPTEPGTRGGQRLSPRFVEWMMGLPAGWVTDVDGISRNEMLRMLGNGVVPQQAEAALRTLMQAVAA